MKSALCCGSNLMDTCIIDIEVHKEVLVMDNFAWVTQLERLKGAQDKVKRPESPPTRSRDPEGPQTSIDYNSYFPKIISRKQNPS